jgi:hypothetical protein
MHSLLLSFWIWSGKTRYQGAGLWPRSSMVVRGCQMSSQMGRLTYSFCYHRFILWYYLLTIDIAASLYLQFLQNYVYLQSFLCLQALNSLICVLNLFLTGMTEACSSMTFMPINKLELQETNNKSSNKSGGICVWKPPIYMISLKCGRQCIELIIYMYMWWNLN